MPKKDRKPHPVHPEHPAHPLGKDKPRDPEPEVPVEPTDPEPQPDPTVNDGPPEPKAEYAEPDPNPNQPASDPEDAVGEDGVRRDVELPDELVPAGDAIPAVEGQARKQAQPSEPGFSLQQAYEGDLSAEDATDRGIDLDRIEAAQPVETPDEKE